MSEKALRVFITKMNSLMLFDLISTVNSENHMKRKNKIQSKNAEIYKITADAVSRPSYHFASKLKPYLSKIC
jgi:hypothetical protein